MKILNAIQAQNSITILDCWSCGGQFGISEDFRKRRYDDGKSFFCCYCGKGQCYNDTKEAKLKRELDAAQAEVERQRGIAKWNQDKASLAERQKRAARGQLTKIKKRVANGVCPCCQRTFENLARHMASQHKGYVDESPGA